MLTENGRQGRRFPNEVWKVFTKKTKQKKLSETVKPFRKKERPISLWWKKENTLDKSADKRKGHGYALGKQLNRSGNMKNPQLDSGNPWYFTGFT